jgi:transcription elongation factor Elf1
MPTRRTVLQALPHQLHRDAVYECPHCNQSSEVKEFQGHVREAACPKCGKKVEPAVKGLMKSLYARQHAAIH